jgi:hypothetical protein
MLTGKIIAQDIRINDTLYLQEWDCLGNGFASQGSVQCGKKYIIIKPDDCKKFPINYEVLKKFNFEDQLRFDYRLQKQ